MPVTAAGKSRFLSAAIIGIGVGLAIIVAVVVFTPLPDDDLNQLGRAAIGNEAQAGGLSDSQSAQASSESSRSSATETTHPMSMSGTSATRQVAATPLLKLPTVPEAFEVDSLQSELRQLAERLPVDYPEDVASFHFAAQAFAELKQFEKADELWKKCLEKTPQYMGPYVGYASMLMDKGRNDEAVEVLKRAEGLGGSAPDMFKKLGEAYENLGDLPNALLSLSAGVKEYPEVAGLWLILGRVQNQLGSASDAEISLRRSLELGGDKEAALFVLNAVLLKQRKMAEATANRDELSKLKQAKGSPSDTFQESYDLALRGIAAEIFAAAGTLAEANDNLNDSERLFVRSASLDPKNVDAFKGLLAVCRRQERIGDQKLVLTRLVEIRPDDLINCTNLASVAMQLGDPGLAESTLKKAIQIDPQGVLAQAALAKLYLSTGNFEESRSFAAQVVERHPSSGAYRLLAATYQASGTEDAFRAANEKADELAAAERAASSK